jgi:uncharacterized protein (TIGR03435 family)
MTCGSRIAVAFCFIAVAAAQQPKSQQPPTFDVVSIRPVPPNPPRILVPAGFTGVLPGGKFINSRGHLPRLISLAYDVEAPIFQRIEGLPDWAKRNLYAISAVPAQDFAAFNAAENEKQVRLMLRAMLEDRFHLQMHIETRQEEVLCLEVGKGGFRFKEVDPPMPSEKEGQIGVALSNNGGRIRGNKSTISGLADTLSIFLERPMIDRTGLKGYYDFAVSWTAPEGLDGQPPTAGLGPDGMALLITALKDQFGLQVRKSTGPVKYWVVDHIEPPTGND